MKTLKEEREAIVESMRKMPCKACGGDGYTVEYDPRDQTGQTPMQAQCDYCHAEGRYTTLDEVRTALLSHEEKVVARVNKLLVTDFPTAWKVLVTNKENHHEKCSWRVAGLLCDCAGQDTFIATIKYLKDALTLPITDEAI